jgi:hypothetical protein
LLNSQLPILDIATEIVASGTLAPTHRPALKDLLEAFYPGVIATNEPKHIKCGAPDTVWRYLCADHLL